MRSGFWKSRGALIAGVAAIGLTVTLLIIVLPPSATRVSGSSDGPGGIFGDFAGSAAHRDSGDVPIAPAALRQDLPENLYWQAVAHPRDEAETRAQNQLHERWATLYGKIYAGRASRDEIDEYYTAQIRLQTDQLEILRHLEERYIEDLSPEKMRLLEAGKQEYHRRLQNVQAEYKIKLDQINK